LKRAAGYLLIPHRLFENLRRRTGEGLLNQKDLLTLFPPDDAATSSGFQGPFRLGKAYLLIPQWLLSKLGRTRGEGLVNLKDLLTALPPSLKDLSEDERVLRPPSCAESHQIPPFSDKDGQMVAEDRAFLRPAEVN